MFINQSCQPPWQLRTLQSDKGEIILQDQMIGKNKKVAHFCPPLKEGGLFQSSTMKKSSKKCPSSNPTSEHGFPRKYYPHFHRSRPGKTLTDGKNICSQGTMFKSSKEINIKNYHQVDKNACAPKNQHAYLTALGTKRASLAMLFVCGATLTLT